MSSSSSASVLSLNIDATKYVEDSENLGGEPDQSMSNEDFNHTYANIGNGEIKTEEKKSGIFHARLMILSDIKGVANEDLKQTYENMENKDQKITEDEHDESSTGLKLILVPRSLSTATSLDSGMFLSHPYSLFVLF